jgi:hypothetical protein
MIVGSKPSRGTSFVRVTLCPVKVEALRSPPRSANVSKPGRYVHVLLKGQGPQRSSSIAVTVGLRLEGYSGHSGQWRLLALQHCKTDGLWHTFIGKTARWSRPTVCPTASYLLPCENIYKPEWALLLPIYSFLFSMWANVDTEARMKKMTQTKVSCQASRLIGWHFCFVSYRPWVQLSARTPAALTGFLWLSAVPSGKFRNSMLRQTKTASFPIHH